MVELCGMGFELLPSRANFLFARHPDIDGGRLYEALKKRGILIRHFTDPKISQFNRITIGTEDDMAALLQALRAVLPEKGGKKP